MKKIGLEAKVNQYVLEWGLWSDKHDIDVWLEKVYPDLQFGAELRTKVCMLFCLVFFLNACYSRSSSSSATCGSMSRPAC
jgi:hypothetical protein